jgi:AcrR family transcriptional regulator
MGRKPVEKRRLNDPEIRLDWTFRLIPVFLQFGFQRLNMDMIARKLKISKATLYNQFRSREEMFELAIDTILEGISQQRSVFNRQGVSFQDRYLYLFALILKQVMGISPVLVKDIKVGYPHLWVKVENFYQSWEKDLIDFFELGISAGEFQDINPVLVSRSLISSVQQIVEPEFLEQTGLSISQALADLFRLHSESFFQQPDLELNQAANEERLSSILAEVGVSS